LIGRPLTFPQAFIANVSRPAIHIHSVPACHQREKAVVVKAWEKFFTPL
jgi:hypothetical protein